MNDRHHFVFVNRCGCPIGLTEMRSSVRTEDDAWDNFYDSRREERHARDTGVHVDLVDHETYSEKYFDRMAQGCPHGGAS